MQPPSIPPSQRLADDATAQLLIRESHAQYNNFRQQQLKQNSSVEVKDGPPPPLVPPFLDIEQGNMTIRSSLFAVLSLWIFNVVLTTFR